MGDEALPLGFHHITSENEGDASYRPPTGEMGQKYCGRVSVCGDEGCVDLVCKMEEGEGSGEEEGVGLSSEVGEVNGYRGSVRMHWAGVWASRWSKTL